MSVTHPLRGPSFAWPDGEAYTDHPRGTLKSGKEAEIFLVERRFAEAGLGSSPTSDIASVTPARTSSETRASRTRPRSAATPCTAKGGTSARATAGR